MVFLDAQGHPRFGHPMSVRSISQQAFVVGDPDGDGEGDDDGYDGTSEYDGDSNSQAGVGGGAGGGGAGHGGKGHAGRSHKGGGSSSESGGSGYSSGGASSVSSFLYSTLLPSPLRASVLLCSMCVVIVGLVIALTILIVLYLGTFPKYEICRTHQCTRTATLFIKTMDDSVDPCEDFHKFACGNWISDTASAVSVPMFDHTTIMRDRIVGRLRTLTEAISGSDIDILQQVKKMYDSCVALDKIDDEGFGKLAEFVGQLIPFGNGPSENKGPPSLAKVLGRIRRRTDQNYIIDFSVDPDYMNATYNTIFLDQPDLTLSKDNFDVDGEPPSPSDVLQEYRKVMGDVLGRFSVSYGANYSIFKEMAGSVDKIVELDKVFAFALTDDTLRSKPRMNNLMSLRQLNLIFSGHSVDGQGAGGSEGGNGTSGAGSVNSNVLLLRKKRGAPGGRSKNARRLLFNWVDYLNELFDGLRVFDENSAIIVNDLPYMHALVQILATTSRKELDMYLGWQLIYSLGKDVSAEIRVPLDGFTMKLDGDESRPNRRTQCITLLDSTIPFALTHKYVLKYVNHTVIDETHEMVGNIIRSFKDMVGALDWMDENTIARAILKANHVRAFIGYPDWVTDPAAVERYYKGLRFGSSFFSNMIAMLGWVSTAELRSYQQPVDRSWSSSTDSPAEADAFYDDELNAITFPAGFLQNPFVGMGLRATDYGALGSVIGHELTHGFDTTGRYSDEQGRLNSWWSMDTLDNFLGKAACFVNQYSRYRLPELERLMGSDNHVNGVQTLAENIADNGGIREALSAYRYYVADKGSPEPRLPGLDQYSPEQIFFLAFAQSWCSYMNPISLQNMLLSNVHSPARFRVLGSLSNFDQFSKVWQCKEGSRMNPAHKCVLW